MRRLGAGSLVLFLAAICFDERGEAAVVPSGFTDTPIVSGGNYGWRVYEGSACTGNDPTLCNPGSYLFPIVEYTHAGGRCSVTGGYVYRGLQGALPDGTYVYGDYCTGEIFGWDGGTQTLLLDTTLNISSFGEDERRVQVVGDAEGVGQEHEQRDDDQDHHVEAEDPAQDRGRPDHEHDARPEQDGHPDDREVEDGRVHYATTARWWRR